MRERERGERGHEWVCDHVQVEAVYLYSHGEASLRAYQELMDMVTSY